MPITYSIDANVWKHPDGSGIEGASVWLYDSAKTVVQIATTDANGHVMLSGTYNGPDTTTANWLVYTEKSGYASAACGLWVPELTADPNGTAVLYLTAQATTPPPPTSFFITVDVGTFNGAVVTGASVEIFRGLDHSSAGTGTTDSLGRANITGPLNPGELLNGWYAIANSKAGAVIKVLNPSYGKIYIETY